MRVTVCELPHEAEPLAREWKALCDHTVGERAELVVLPEFAFAPPVWEAQRFDADIWAAVESECIDWLARLPELGAQHVIGTRPVSAGHERFNEGFLWSADAGYRRLRRKYFLPDEQAGWEARWFTRGDSTFPAYDCGTFSFGLNICSELWALDTYAAYAELGVQAVISPRATAAATVNKWLSLATVAAVRVGAFSFSSNRVHPDGSCGGVGWIVSPDGHLLARTSAKEPFRTLDIDFNAAALARRTYPRYLFNGSA